MGVILSGAGFLILVFVVISGIEVRNHFRWERKWKKRSQVYEEWFEASRAFDAWRVARPFLWVGQSSYAQSLVWTMIESYDWLLKDDPTWGHPFVITDLYKLLEEQPPPYTPPTTKASRIARLFFLPRPTKPSPTLLGNF